MNYRLARRRQDVVFRVGFAYPVFFTHGAFAAANPLLRDVLHGLWVADANGAPCRVRVFLDSGLVAAQPELPAAIAGYGQRYGLPLAAEPPAVFPGGEAAKDGFTQVNRMVADLAARRFCRQSVLLAVGGGAFLDAAGFAAALVHRGVRLIRLPSTTLAQDDSGVGTKNGVNLMGQKNYLGTFAPPAAVINDLRLLRTLPAALVADGVAEAFKVAIIKSRAAFDFLCRHAAALRQPDWPVVECVVRQAARLHARHIAGSGDPFERGDARPLDFGHWAAHRLEALSGFTLRHGQAVAVGIALDSWYAWQRGLLSGAEFEAIVTALAAAGLPIAHPLLARRDTAGRLEVLEGLAQFREHLGGRLAITLPAGIGRRVEVNEMDPELIGRGIAFLLARDADTARPAAAPVVTPAA